MEHPRNSVIVTGGAHSTSLTASHEASESSNIKYLNACYKRGYEDCIKFKVSICISIDIFMMS
jgi:hypothetical protein